MADDRARAGKTEDKLKHLVVAENAEVLETAGVGVVELTGKHRVKEKQEPSG